MTDPTFDTTSIRAAITAAGCGQRMGRPKALLPFGETVFLGAMLETLRAAGLNGPFAVVIGAEHGTISPLTTQLGGLPLKNERYEAGRFTSVQLAARWACGEAREGFPPPSLLLWPVDCPAVSPTTIRRLAQEAHRQPGVNIFPSHGGNGGHPVVLCAAFLAKVLAAGEDCNLRDLMREDPIPRVACPVDDRAVLDNVNTQEDYEVFLRERVPLRKA